MRTVCIQTIHMDMLKSLRQFALLNPQPNVVCVFFFILMRCIYVDIQSISQHYQPASAQYLCLLVWQSEPERYTNKQAGRGISDGEAGC